MTDLTVYLKRVSTILADRRNEFPWHITSNIQQLLAEQILNLKSDYIVNGSIAIHKTAVIEEHVILKGPLIISAGCFIASHAYLRGGVLLDENVSIGPGCEVKSSIIFSNSVLAHFNFVGDSLIGSAVNMEAGSVIANHYNERNDKTIMVVLDGKKIVTGIQKFGALVGDETKIGANAVLSPGTILIRKSIVKRLALVDQQGYS